MVECAAKRDAGTSERRCKFGNDMFRRLVGVGTSVDRGLAIAGLMTTTTTMR